MLQSFQGWDALGRILTDEDIDHYQKIIVALSETIRIMVEIDEFIDEHGGWPGAFQTGEKENLRMPQLSPKNPLYCVQFLGSTAGITFGPSLPDGRQTLANDSDSNFSAGQFTQFIVLHLDIGSVA